MAGHRGGWKRGARPGNYTDMQWNIACRVRAGLGPGGAMASEAPKCTTITQARISLGYLQYGTCGKTVGPSSVCAGFTGGGQPSAASTAKYGSTRYVYKGR